MWRKNLPPLTNSKTIFYNLLVDHILDHPVYTPLGVGLYTERPKNVV